MDARQGNDAAVSDGRDSEPLHDTSAYSGSLPSFVDSAEVLPALPGFRVLGELGRGGMGVVYKAVEEATGRVVAIKTLHAAARLEPGLRERFRNEAEAGLRLRHPNIVRAEALREHGNVLFLVLEFVEGQTLSRRLRGQPMPPREAAELTRTLAGAIDHAHRQGVVHRDLKPANVLLDVGAGGSPAPGEEGQASRPPPRLTDFGLARLLDGDALTTTGKILGTPSYMAPEQARAEATRGEPPVDIYGLGAILYHLLTGRPPFLADSAHAILAQVADPAVLPARPSLLNRDVSLDLEAICLRCLEKEPAKRYPSAAALAEDLDRYLGGRRVRAPRWSPFRAAVRLARHNKIATAILLGALLTLAGSAIWSIAMYRFEAAARELAERRLYAQTLQRADRQGASEPGEAFDLLHVAADCPPYLRGLDWGLLARRFAPARPFAAQDGVVFTVAASPDHKSFASGGADSTVKLWDARSGTLLRTLRGHTGPVMSVSFHPKRDLLASAGADGCVVVWDAGTGEKISEQKLKSALGGVAFSPNGKSLAAGGADGVVRVWSLDHPSQRTELRGHGLPVVALGFHPSGNELATASGASKVPHGMRGLEPVAGGEVFVWNVSTGAKNQVASLRQGRIGALAYSPGGEYLAFATAASPGSISLLDTANGYKKFDRFAPAPFGHLSLAFSPDGKSLAAGGDLAWRDKNGESASAVWVYDVATGAERYRLPGPALSAHALALAPTALPTRPTLATAGGNGSLALRPLTGDAERFDLPPTAAGRGQAISLSADGRWLLCAHDREAVLWDVSSLAAPVRARSFQDHARSLRAAALSADGRRAALAGQDKTVRIYDLATPTAEPLKLDHGSVVTSLLFLRDGQLVSAGDGHDLIFWDGTAGERLSGHTGPVSAVAASADGRRLATAGERQDGDGNAVGGEVLLWDATSRHLLKRLDTEPLGGLAFHPDGRVLATGHAIEEGRAGMVRLWDAKTLSPLASWRVERGGVTALTFSPDGLVLGAVCPDSRGDAPSSLRLWDGSGDERLSLRGGDKKLTRLTFAAEKGRRFAASSLDGGVIVWEAADPLGGD